MIPQAARMGASKQRNSSRTVENLNHSFLTMHQSPNTRLVPDDSPASGVLQRDTLFRTAAWDREDVLVRVDVVLASDVQKNQEYIPVRHGPAFVRCGTHGGASAEEFVILVIDEVLILEDLPRPLLGCRLLAAVASRCGRRDIQLGHSYRDRQDRHVVRNLRGATSTRSQLIRVVGQQSCRAGDRTTSHGSLNERGEGPAVEEGNQHVRVEKNENVGPGALDSAQVGSKG